MSGANRFPGGNGNPGRHPGGYGNQPGYGGQQGGEEDMYNQYGSHSYEYDEEGMDAYNQGFYNQQPPVFNGPVPASKPSKNKRPTAKSNVEVPMNYSGGVAHRYPDSNRKKYANWKSTQLEPMHFDPQHSLGHEPHFDYSYGYEHSPVYPQSNEPYPPDNPQDEAVWDSGIGMVYGQEVELSKKAQIPKPSKKNNNSASQKLTIPEKVPTYPESAKLEPPKPAKPVPAKPAKAPTPKPISVPAPLEIKSGPMVVQIGAKKEVNQPTASKQKDPPEKIANSKAPTPGESPPQKGQKKASTQSSNLSSGPLQVTPGVVFFGTEEDDHQDLDLDDMGPPAPPKKTPILEVSVKEELDLGDPLPKAPKKQTPASQSAVLNPFSSGAVEEAQQPKLPQSPKKPPIKKEKNSGPLSKFGSDPLVERSETNSNKNPRSQKNSQGLDPRLMATITEEGSKMSRALKSRNNRESSAHNQSVRRLEAKGALEDFKNLTEGLYFKDESFPSISFLIHPKQQPKAWLDDYIINGYLVTGIMLSVPSLSSVVYVFIDRSHEIYHRYFRTKEGVVSWRNLSQIKNAPCIGILSCVERVELFDNTIEGFQGRCCFMAMSNCHLSFTNDSKTVKDWMEYQMVRLLYEPGMIQNVFIPNISKITTPEDPLCKPTCVPVYFNPKTGELPVRFSHKLAHVEILEGDYCVGVIELLHGKYTMISHTRHIFFTVLRLAERALEGSEELGVYVCLHNARRFFIEDDKHGQVCVLIAPFEPLISLVRFVPEDGTEAVFSPEVDKVSSLLPMQDETINPVPILPDS